MDRVLYHETHTLLDELGEATLDGRRKERMEFLETVPPLIIDDSGIRKLPLTAAEELLEIIMRRDERASTLLTANRPIEDLGKTVGRHRCCQRQARPSPSPRACAQVRSAKLEIQNRTVYDGTTKSERNGGEPMAFAYENARYRHRVQA